MSAFIGPADRDYLSTVAQLMSRIRQKSVVMNNPCSGRHLHRRFANRGMMDCHIDVQPAFVTDVALARQ